MDTAARYIAFADHEARGESATYERLAQFVAASPGLIDLLETLPIGKRQPNLLFGAVRSLGGPIAEPDSFLTWVSHNWPAVERVVLTHLTQTNEAGRLGVLMPIMASLDQPLALLEVGAAAGLCLYPDRWRYDYGDVTVGNDGQPTLECAVTGRWSPPQRLPEVVWRAGIDLNPLDVTNSSDMEWLRHLIWPEHVVRAERLESAIEIAREDPPRLVAGDLVETLASVAAEAPQDATLVIFHSAVLAYLAPDSRRQFLDQVAGFPGHWIANEGPAALPGIAQSVAPREPGAAARFLTCLDGQPVAWSGPHGQSVEWL